VLGLSDFDRFAFSRRIAQVVADEGP
jgi:hypothetical protein